MPIDELAHYYDVDFTKKGELGKGHYAVVYKGVRKKDESPIAVKKIARKLTEIETLKTEVDALRAVNGHKNIVQLFDVFYDNKHVMLVMEMLAGGELFDRIMANGAYSERDASKHFRKLTLALNFMHGQKIIHRDLKPENLVLKDRSINSDIKISDFGLSKILNESEVSSSCSYCIFRVFMVIAICLYYPYCRVCICHCCGCF